MAPQQFPQEGTKALPRIQPPPTPFPEEGVLDAVLSRRERYYPALGCLTERTIVQTRFKLKQPLLPSGYSWSSVSLGFEAVDVEPSHAEGRLHSAILYKGPEHPPILVSGGCWDQSPTDTEE